MLKQTTESVIQALVKPRCAPILTAAAQQEILKASKNVRCVDYVSNYVIPETSVNARADSIVTRANWLFILTGIAIYNRMGTTGIQQPRFKFTFPDLANTGRIKNRTDSNELDTAPAMVYMGCEGLDVGSYPNYHFEEFKNVFHVLPERAVIDITIMPYVQMNGLAWNNTAGSILFTGVEISMENTGLKYG